MKYFVDTPDSEYTDVTYKVTVEDHVSSDEMWSTSIILSIPYRQRVFCAPGGCGAHSVSQIKMGHRAIVAYERTDGTYSLHYSNRGAFEYRLRETIGATNPFGEGSNEIWATETIERIRAGDPIEHNPLKEQSGSTSVDPMPRGSVLHKAA